MSITTTPATTPASTVTSTAAEAVTSQPQAEYVTVLFPSETTGRVEPTSTTARVDGSQPVVCSLDRATFATSGFNIGAAILSYYTDHRPLLSPEDHDRYVPNGDGEEFESVMHTLGMYLPSIPTACDDDVKARWCLEEVVMATAADVARLPEEERGHYLGQLLTTWFLGDRLPWQRLGIGEGLATYFRMLPHDATPLGVHEVNDDARPGFAWQTPFGVFVDLIEDVALYDTPDDHPIADTLAYGAQTWGEDFGGVRYLPLKEPEGARTYLADGTEVRVKQASSFSHDCQSDYCCSNVD